MVTICGHVFCYQCVSDNLTGEDNTCPAPECKGALGADVVYSRSTLRRSLSVDADGDNPVSHELGESKVLKSSYISSKIKSTLEIIKSYCISMRRCLELLDLDECDMGGAASSAVLDLNSEENVPEKAIIFSQWTSMLDLVEMSLKEARINYRRLDGTMSIAARDKGVKDFNTDPEVMIHMFISFYFFIGLDVWHQSVSFLVYIFVDFPLYMFEGVVIDHYVSNFFPSKATDMAVTGYVPFFL